jgi:undecaprenyl-diphosphatase
VQGLTEFLPISSTAHLKIISTFLGWQDPGAAFTAIVQIGTMLALIIYFFNDIFRFITFGTKSILHKNLFETTESKQAWMIVCGTIPIVIFGFIFKHAIETYLRSLYVISGTLIILALVLAAAEKTAKMKKEVKDVSWFESQVMGFCQAIALIPGVSRSGVTITAGLFSGLTREAAARFSFLLSIPAVFASGIYELWEVRHQISGDGLTAILISTIVSGIVGYLSIEFLLRFLRKNSTFVFIYYRIILGCLIIFLLLSGIIAE